MANDKVATKENDPVCLSENKWREHIPSTGEMGGLPSAEAKRRLLKYGYNELVAKKENKDLKILIRQIVKNPIVYILFIAALLSYYAGEEINFIVILFVIAYVIGVGFYQERKAERAMEALKAMVVPESRVLRDGTPTIIPAREIVPGDVVVLEMGDSIPADAIVFDSHGLRVDEASLTGESIPANKNDGEIVHMGTQVVYGKCKAMVIATGMKTQLGRIAEMIQTEEEETPLQKKINRLVKYFAFLSLGFSAFLLALGISDPTVNLLGLLIIILALIVASVPEGLPLVLTTALAMGMNKLAQKNAIIRRITAVETLGAVTVICTDKTGTLTRNEMVVEKVFFDGKMYDVMGFGYAPSGTFMLNGSKVSNSELEKMHSMMKAAVLCNNSTIEKKNGAWKVVGDPTEGALISMAAKCGVFKKEMDKKCPKLVENFFTSERKFMSTVHRVGGNKVAYAKGAPEVIISRCSHILKDGKRRKICTDDYKKIENTIDALSRHSLRVMAFARCESRRAIESGKFEENMTFLGLVGMADPVREEVLEAMDACRTGGIRVIMITGDNPNTARAIGTKIGLADENSKVLTGADIDSMGPKEFRKAIMETNIFARTNPEHKLRIISALKERGEIVAMTGDGVNDAPALKKADIGIAMGIKGTDVAKESSDMVLADDNFATIVEAIRGGRGIYENIQKTVAFILSWNYAEVFLLMFAFLILGPQFAPLLALQILFINIIDEEIPALVLALDKPRKGIMNVKPRNPKEGILPLHLLVLIFSVAAISAILVYAVFTLAGPHENLQMARTVAFASILASVIFAALCFKSLEEPLSLNVILSNKMLLLAVVASALVGLAAIYHPFLQKVFHTLPLGPMELAMALGVGLATVAFLEIGKFIIRVRKRSCVA